MQTCYVVDGEKIYFLPLNLSTQSVSCHSVKVLTTKLSIGLKQTEKERTFTFSRLTKQLTATSLLDSKPVS